MSEMLSQIFKSLALKIKPGEVSDAPCLLCPIVRKVYKKCINFWRFLNTFLIQWFRPYNHIWHIFRIPMPPGSQNMFCWNPPHPSKRENHVFVFSAYILHFPKFIWTQIGQIHLKSFENWFGGLTFDPVECKIIIIRILCLKDRYVHKILYLFFETLGAWGF